MCHRSATLQSYDNLNAFGKSFEAANGGYPVDTPDADRASHGSAHDSWTWSNAVAILDADGDGFTNGEELQDPTGSFTQGAAQPGQADLVTVPADPASKPTVVDASFTSGDPNSASSTVEQSSAPADLPFTINATGSTSAVAASSSASWLSLESGATSSGGALRVDPAGLAPGSYDATATISQGGIYRNDVLSVHLVITPLCGNGRLDGGESCDPGADVANDCCTADCKFVSAGTECRASVDSQCDPHEVCSGTDASCPANSFVADSTPCTISGCTAAEQGQCSSGICKEIAAVCGDGHQQCGEQCDLGGNPGDCCNDDGPGAPCTLYSAADHKLCRAASGVCDLDDFCSGASPLCTLDAVPDAVRPAGSVCRPANGGGCDVAEACDGHAKTCPADAFQPAGAICRAADSSGCDTPERCDGTGGGCPANGFLPEGTYCTQTKVCATGGLCVSPEPQPQSKDQVRCLHKWNAAAASSGDALARQASKCFAKGVKGKLSGAIDGCLEPTSQTSAVISKQDHAARATCAKNETPGFGTSSTADLAELTSAAVSGAYHDVFGNSLAGVVPADSASGAQCQAAVSKTFAKCIGGRFTSFATCVRKGLKGKDASIDSFVGVQDCMGFESNAAHLACSLTQGTQSSTKKALDKSCPDDASVLGAAFPGCLADETDDALSRTDLYSCLDRASKCRTCQALVEWGNLATNCDLFDDGLPDGSCN